MILPKPAGTLELLPGAFAFFIYQGSIDSQLLLFGELLEDVWTRIPQDDGYLILRHYSETGRRPDIVLGCRILDDLNCPVAKSDPTDFMIWLDASRLFTRPGKEAWAIETIAHEFAHCLLFAKGDYTHRHPPAPVGDPAFAEFDEAREAAAEKVSAAWGFDAEEYQRLKTWTHRARAGWEPWG